MTHFILSDFILLLNKMDIDYSQESSNEGDLYAPFVNIQK